MQDISRHSTGGNRRGIFLFLPPYNGFFINREAKPSMNLIIYKTKKIHPNPNISITTPTKIEPTKLTITLPCPR